MITDALISCAHVLIPSLFPYMVISSVLVRTGASEWLSIPFRRVTEKLFRLPGCAGGAIILGALCGFPVGAKSACELYTREDISRREAERLIALANNTGPAFVIEVVGGYLWQCRGLGIMLYLVQLVSALLIGWIAARWEPRAESERNLPPHSMDDASILACISSSVSDAAGAMLSVCGFVIFFSAVCASLRFFLDTIGLSAAFPLLSVLLEFSGGCSAAASIGGGWGAFLTGLAVGWSGISVFAQSSVFTSRCGIRLRFAAVSKLLQGILCGICTMLYFRYRMDGASTACSSITLGDFPEYALYAEIIILILFCLFPILPKKTGKQSKTSAQNR